MTPMPKDINVINANVKKKKNAKSKYIKTYEYKKIQCQKIPMSKKTAQLKVCRRLFCVVKDIVVVEIVWTENSMVCQISITIFQTLFDVRDDFFHML